MQNFEMIYTGILKNMAWAQTDSVETIGGIDSVQGLLQIT